MSLLYNEKIKREYIEHKNSSSSYNDFFLYGKFKKSCPFETKLDKDLCNFSYYDITEMYKMFNLKSTMALNVINSVFSLYTTWCLSNGLVKDGQNHFKELHSNDMKSLLSPIKRDISRITIDDINSYLDDLPNAKDKYVILGLFELGKANDFEILKYAYFNDVNREAMTIEVNGKVMRISESLLKVIDECSLEDKYIALKGDGKVTELKDTGRIFKDYMNTKDEVSSYQLGRRIYTHMRRCMDYLGLLNVISPADIVVSGMIHFIKTESAKIGIDSKDYIWNYKNEIDNQFLCNINCSSFIIENKEYL